jgi:hypothetical protein
MDQFFIEVRGLELLYFKPVYPKQIFQIKPLSDPSQEGFIKKIITALGFEGRLGREYKSFIQFLENEKISVEDAMAVIKNSRLIPKEAR